MLGPLLEQIDQLSLRFGEYDRLLQTIADQRGYPETSRLRAVPGVGPITALSFVRTLADPQRFAHSREVGPYLGLQPKQRQSGGQKPQWGISKAGDQYLRKLLGQYAHYTVGRFGAKSRLRTWGLSLAERRRKSVPLWVMARKLAVWRHRLWGSDTPYKPFFGMPKPPNAD